MMDNNRRKETRTKLEALESAITRFVMTNQRLPCPADGALSPTDTDYGRESVATGLCNPNELSNGVVPWRSLAVPQDAATDAWGNHISYRVWAGVANSLTLANGMDMSLLDPANGTAVSDWLQTRGFRACDGRNVPNCPAADELARQIDGNGVAYFLISHGANKFAGYSPSGTLAPVNGPGPGPRENINRNGQLLRTASPADFYVDTDLTEDPANYYDDIVLRPTVMKVVLDAGLGPRVTP